MVRGIPVTTPECTLLNLGAVVRPSTVELALEEGLRRGLFTIGSLRGTLKRLGKKGRNGAGVLRGLLDQRDPDAVPTDTRMETRVIQMLRRNGLPEPARQFNIFDGPRFVARVDFAYPQWKIALEYESYEHHTGRAALDRDNPRRNALIALGWKPLGITGNDVRTGGALVSMKILEAARR
jgi:very-short-patch-repair endonuclease